MRLGVEEFNQLVEGWRTALIDVKAVVPPLCIIVGADAHPKHAPLLGRPPTPIDPIALDVFEYRFEVEPIKYIAILILVGAGICHRPTLCAVKRNINIICNV